MKITINRTQNTVRIFYLLLFFSEIGYLGYYIASLNMNWDIYSYYSNYTFSRLPLWAEVFRWMKDVLIIILFLQSLMQLRYKKACRVFLILAAFFICGAVNAVFHEANFIYILTGMRTYIYFVVLLLLTLELKGDFFNIGTINKVVIFGLIINGLIGLEQLVRGTNGDVGLIGRGGYRFPSLYGGVNGVAGFSIGAILFFWILSKHKKIKMWKMLILFSLCFFLAINSGARSAIINVTLILVLYLVDRVKTNSLSKWLTLIPAAIVVMPIIIIISMKVADRGSILQVQMQDGRIAVFLRVIRESSIIEFIFGHGLGIGSNSNTLLQWSMSSNSYYEILDGTFTTIYFQFGLVGLLVLFYFFYRLYNKMRNSNSSLAKVGFMGTLILQCITGSVMETFSFLILIFITYWILCFPDVFYYKGNNEKVSDTMKIHHKILFKSIGA